MIRPRLIPVLLLKHGVIVRSQLFKVHQVIGNPMSTVERLSDWNVDELVILDISADDYHDLRRDDIQQRYQGTSAVDVLREVAKVCFMPLTFGGRIRTLDTLPNAFPQVPTRFQSTARRLPILCSSNRHRGVLAHSASSFQLTPCGTPTAGMRFTAVMERCPRGAIRRIGRARSPNRALARFCSTPSTATVLRWATTLTCYAV